MLSIRIPKTNAGTLHINVDVVRPSVPLLIGLDLSGQKQLVTNNVDNILERQLRGWKRPISQIYSHVYITWADHVSFFTRQELLRMKRKFYHPSSNKCQALICRWRLGHIDRNTREMLNEISRSCNTCQTFFTNSEWFTVSVANEKSFNREVALELMYIYKKDMLHFVYIESHFQSAKVLKKTL